MLILTIKTDESIAEIELWENEEFVDKTAWEAHRTLADSIHIKIIEILGKNNFDWHDIKGLVVYGGPGSFTGLRIGISVANALSYGLSIPIIGQNGKNWVNKGIKMLLKHQNDNLVLPTYGGAPHITSPQK